MEEKTKKEKLLKKRIQDEDVQREQQIQDEIKQEQAILELKKQREREEGSGGAAAKVGFSPVVKNGGGKAKDLASHKSAPQQQPSQ